MVAMRFNNGVVSNGKIVETSLDLLTANQDYSKQNQLDSVKNGVKEENISRIDYSNPPLKKLNLRANHLKGNLILGNFTVRKFSPLNQAER